MPKEKKSKLFSLFKKKAPKEQPAIVQTVTPSDSFADINDLIPTPEIVYKKKPVKEESTVKIPESPKVEAKDLLEKTEPVYTKVEKSKRKERAAPPPPQERAVDVGEAAGPKKPPRDPKELSVEEKKALIRKQLSEDQEQERMSSRKSSVSSGSRVVETNVLHYSPQTQHRPSTSSPIPVSEAPPVERQSNIILNGTARVKAIPVSQYDGKPKQAPPPPPPLVPTVEKMVPPPPPVYATPPTVASLSPASYHRKQTSLDSAMPRNGPAKLDGPPKVTHHRGSLTPAVETKLKTKEQEDILRRYEEIKSKFDLWQMLKEDERHSKEAKDLQLELIRDHDTIVELYKKASSEDDVPSPGQIQKKRPSIAPDTYTPRLPVTNSIRSPLIITATYSNNSVSSSSPNSSSPGTSRSVTPKNAASSPSVSPVASVDSSDSGVVRGGRSDYAVPKIEPRKAQSVDENANVLKRLSKPRDSIEIQKQIAINRINDEVREQRRKESELKRLSQTALSFNAEEEEQPRLEPKKSTPVVNGAINGIKSPPPTSNGLSNGVPIYSKPVSKPPEPPKPQKVVAPLPTAAVSRVLVNNSSPIQRPTMVSKAQQLSPSPVTQNQGKTVVTVNTEKVYATPKAVISPQKAVDAPRTPPLPNTAPPSVPKLPNRVGKDDEEVIYKVSGVRKTIPIKEENNNVVKLSPIKDPSTRQPRSPTAEKKKNERAARSQTKEIKTIPIQIVEHKPEVTSDIKTTIATSRVKKIETPRKVEQVKSPKVAQVKPVNTINTIEVKLAVKEIVEKGKVSRNIADTLAKHNNHSRPALDLSAMLDRSTLRKVTPPVERNGIALGRVVDSPQTPSTSTSTPVTYITSPPPPPPPPPPMMVAPPPPPPPPADLLVTPIYQVPSPIVRPMSMPVAPPPPPPLVTSSQLNDQKQRLRTPIYTDKPSSPLDLRDSLMAEIRNAGGLRGLRKVNRN